MNANKKTVIGNVLREPSEIVTNHVENLHTFKFKCIRLDGPLDIVITVHGNEVNGFKKDVTTRHVVMATGIIKNGQMDADGIFSVEKNKYSSRQDMLRALSANELSEKDA